MDDHIALPAFGKISQGVIFSGAQAEDYFGNSVHGLFITARCDFAHDKVRIYNYLPIVSLRDWVMKDGRFIFCERAIADTVGGMKSCLKQFNFSDSILEIETPIQILNTLYPATSEDRKIKKGREQFEGLVKRLTELEKTRDSHVAHDVFRLMGTDYPKIGISVLRDLMNQQLSGYYFFSKISPKGEDSGFVTLLREIHYLPQELVASISSGIDKDDYDLVVSKNPLLANKLAFDVAEFVEPIGRVTSPYIEHLMQAFSLLFARVGVTDLSSEYRNKIWAKTFK